MLGLRTGDELHTLTGHSVGVSAVALTADGRRAVSASRDNTLKLWDLQSEEALRTLTGHTSDVLAVAVTPDGRRAVSASEDNTLKLWDLESVECLCTWSAEGEVRSFAVAPDQLTIVAGDAGGHVHFLRLENVTPGPPFCTSWQAPALPWWRFWRKREALPVAFGCLHCRVWSQVTEAVLGTELPCPNCGKAVKLNEFVIEADWRPVAAAWRGEVPRSWLLLRDLEMAADAVIDSSGSEDAKQQWYLAIDATAQELGPGSVPLALMLQFTALRFNANGIRTEANDAALRAVTVRQEQANTAVAGATRDLVASGDALLDAGMVEAGCGAYEAALALDAPFLDDAQPQVWSKLDQLGRGLSDQGQYADALCCHRLALRIAERMEGVDGESCAASLNNLASIHLRQGRAEEVIPLSSRALEIDSRIYGDDHQWPALDRSKLGWAYLQLDRAAEALPLLEKAAAVLEKTLGEAHEHTRNAREWLRECRDVLGADRGGT